MKTYLVVRLVDLFRAVMLLLSLLHFLGWGFSGEVGLPGHSMLAVVGATLAVAVTPDGALRDPILRVLYVAIDLAGVAGIAFWTAHSFVNSGSTPEWPPLFFGGVTGLGLLAGLARLRYSEESHESPEG